MDNIPSNNPTQQTVAQPVEQPTVVTESKPVEKKSEKTVLLIIIAVLFLLLLGTVGVLAYQNGYLDKVLSLPAKTENNDQNTEQNDTETNTQEETSNTQTEDTYFEGTTVRALQPEGWTIQEFYNGDGTESLVDGTTYEGLTGLKILHGTQEVFSVRAVSGIGFVGCPMYAQFDDYNPSDMAQNQSMADEVGDTMTVTDYRNTEYVEFDWLGTTFRRIGLNYFYDDQEGNNYFEPPCVSGLLVLEGLNFTDSNGYLGEAYFYGAATDATEAELQTVDQILESMTLQ